MRKALVPTCLLAAIVCLAASPLAASDEQAIGLSLGPVVLTGDPIQVVEGYDAGVYWSIGGKLVATNEGVRVDRSGTLQFHLEGTHIFDPNDGTADPGAGAAWAVFVNGSSIVFCSPAPRSAAVLLSPVFFVDQMLAECRVQGTVPVSSGDLVQVGVAPNLLPMGDLTLLFARLEISLVTQRQSR